MTKAKRSPRLQAELERIAGERLAAEQEISRTKRRELARVCLECIASTLLGLIAMGFALHTTDETLGKIAFWAGLLIGYSGLAYALFGAYRRGEERGDW